MTGPTTPQPLQYSFMKASPSSSPDLPLPVTQPPTSCPPGDRLERTSGGQFRAGHSGNPAGRPRSESTALRLQMAEHAEGVLHAVLEAALSGDMAAAKMILDRLVPPLRPHAESVLIPLDAPAGPAATAEAILAAAVTGKIPPDAAMQLLSATASLTRIIETAELQARLEALERAVTPPKP